MHTYNKKSRYLFDICQTVTEKESVVELRYIFQNDCSYSDKIIELYIIIVSTCLYQFQNVTPVTGTRYSPLTDLNGLNVGQAGVWNIGSVHERIFYLQGAYNDARPNNYVWTRVFLSNFKYD